MPGNDIGVVLNGVNEVLRIEIFTNQPMFYYLKYFSCTRRPEFYNILLTKDGLINIFKCFRCGKKHRVKDISTVFIDLFAQINNGLRGYLDVSGPATMQINFIKAIVKSLRLNDFIIV